MSTGFQDPSDTVFLGGAGATIGADQIQAVTPVVTAFGQSSIAQQYASTFDYLQQFTTDNLGYRTYAKDLAYIEMWAADHQGGGVNKFYCDKVPAKEIPINGIVPVYNGRWTKLGEGRTYNLFVRYQHKDGNASLFSNAIANNITNLGIGPGGLAANPNPSIGPVVASASIGVSTGTAPTGTFSLTMQLTPPATPNGWMKYLVVYAVPTTGTPAVVGMAVAPPAYTPPTARVMARSDGNYTAANAIPLSLPMQPTNGSSGYNIFVGYEDRASNVGALTQAVNIYNSSMSGAITAVVQWYSGSGPPGSLAPATSPAIYANTASGAAHGSLLYAWNGSTWSAFA